MQVIRTRTGCVLFAAASAFAHPSVSVVIKLGRGDEHLGVGTIKVAPSDSFRR